VGTANINKAEELMEGRKMKNEFGSCFDSIAPELIDLQFVIPISVDEIAVTEHEDFSDVKICHAIGVANMPGQEGQEMAHAWIEFNDTKGNVKVAFDVIWGLATPSNLYRHNLSISHIVEYTIQEFYNLWEENGTPGPWDKKIKEVSDRVK
tara:strand:+ start:429 stop:881 length:453 start_codon:yes stop_codon:yes gene_type:complete